MDVHARVESALHRHLSGRTEPPRLGDAINHAVFPGGARVRPVFALGVALACGDDRPAVADALAVAVECLHCGSLVHDDLPCFDNASVRRGRPSVHAAHGQALAVLAGDSLIVLAFQVLSDVAAEAGDRLPKLLEIIATSAGTPAGLIGGQALESEDDCTLSDYHGAKTGALFRAAALGGAVAAGGDEALWARVGDGLGAAYQIADDIHDHTGGDLTVGKPMGQDSRLGRPSAVELYGLDGAVSRLKRTLSDTVEQLPEGEGAAPLRHLIGQQTKRFLPKSLSTVAA